MREEQTNLTEYEIGGNRKSEQEIYCILLTEGKAYLPLSRKLNYNFVTDIISGKRM